MPVYSSLFLQLVTVLSISYFFGRNIPLRLRILLSAALVTVPVWVYGPLADAGIVYALDIVVPLLLMHEMYVRDFRFNTRGLGIALGTIFLYPLVFAPLSYFFLDPQYYAYHSVLLVNVLARCLLLAGALVIFSRDLELTSMPDVCRLMAYQLLGLFILGSLQYLGGVDLVVYERFKDTENVVDAKLSGLDKTLYGFGFLGLFRGAVAQMAIIAIFWWLLWERVSRQEPLKRALQILTYFLVAACVVGSLSRIGLIAIVLVFAYILVVIRNKNAWILVLAGLFCAFLVTFWFPKSESFYKLAILGARYGLEELSGQIGSGRGRIESASSLVAAMSQEVWPWLTGLGGFNPIATSQKYEVYGMHGDYLDILVRYGVLLGLAYLGALLLLFYRQLKGFYSRNTAHRELSRRFGAFALGIALLALTQGALLFSGTAGYLAAVQAWLVIAFCIKAQGSGFVALDEKIP